MPSTGWHDDLTQHLTDLIRGQMSTKDELEGQRYRELRLTTARQLWPPANLQPIEDFDRAVGGSVKSPKDAFVAGSWRSVQGMTSAGAHTFGTMPVIAPVSMKSPGRASYSRGNPGGDSVSSGTPLPVFLSWASPSGQLMTSAGELTTNQLPMAGRYPTISTPSPEFYGQPSASNGIASPGMDASSLFVFADFSAGFSNFPSTYPELIKYIRGRLFEAGETGSAFTTTPSLLNPPCGDVTKIQRKEATPTSAVKATPTSSVATAETSRAAEASNREQRRVPIIATRSFCSFCRTNGETADVYKSHSLHDAEGNVSCPALFKHICELCGSTGSSAHTRKYCLQYEPQTELTDVKALKATKRTAAGRRYKFGQRL